VRTARRHAFSPPHTPPPHPHTPPGCLKDLQRFLRKDDPDTRDVFFKLGAFDTARKDLVPLLVTYPHDQPIVYNARACGCGCGCGAHVHARTCVRAHAQHL